MILGTVAYQSLCPWDFQARIPPCLLLTGGIFPTQGLNPCLLCLLHCRQILYCQIETVKINLRFLWAALVSASRFVNRCHPHLSGNSAHGGCVCVRTCARMHTCGKKWSLIPQWCLTTCILNLLFTFCFGAIFISLVTTLFHCKFKILVFYLQLWKHCMLIRTSGTGHSYQLHCIWISDLK